MKLSVMLEQLSSGMLRSMEIFFLTLIFSLPLGLLISFGRMSKNKILRTIIKVYISVMQRNAADAAAAGRIFWPILPVWDADRRDISVHGDSFLDLP